MRPHVIFAVFKRNVTSYFSSVLGYLFIVAFVVAGGFLAFNDRFFAENLATFDQLSVSFPLLLLFIVPAITMTAWADERKLGTDELLFTLPATDFEILLGKYKAVKAVFFVALLFSLAHAFMLSWIGSPDWGLIATTYLGYLLAGTALLAVGLLASSLTNSSTVAFVYGVVLCAVPVFIDRLPVESLPIVGDVSLESFSVAEQLKDFTLGMVPLSGVLYFLSLAGLALYLNSIVIGRRHWAGQTVNGGMGWQYAVRGLAALVGLVAVNHMTGHASARADLTSERVYSVTDSTRDILKTIPENRPVTIQAFISPQVPQEYAGIRRELVGLLRQLDSTGGSNVTVRYVDTEPFSEPAEEARKYGIEPRTVQSQQNGRFSAEEIFLGAHIASGFDEVVIPFFDRGTGIEYQISRAVGTVSKEERLTVGVLKTDASVMGGFDMASMRQQPRWQLIEELSRQYRVKEITPDSPIDAEAFDVLLAVMPSTLTEPEMNHLVKYVSEGGPTLVVDDPLPMFDIRLAPSESKPAPGGGGMFGGGQQGPPKADDGRLTSLANTLGVQWLSESLLFDQFNPHPQFGNAIEPSIVFITGKGDYPDALNPNSEITAGLEETIAFFPGQIVQRQNNRDVEYTPLLVTAGKTSGSLEYENVILNGLFGPQLNPALEYVVDEQAHAIAAKLAGKPDGDTPDLNVIFVGDADIFSDMMYRLQESAPYGFQIDNVTFLMNAIDHLAADSKYILLRSRRARFRTLTRVENATTNFLEDANVKREEAEEEAKARLEAANERLEEVRERIESDATLDATAKRQQLGNVLAAERRRLEKEEAEIERQKQNEIRQVEAQTQREVRRIENGIRFWALVIPPLPALLLGIFVLGIRKLNEENTLPKDRTVRA